VVDTASGSQALIFRPSCLANNMAAAIRNTWPLAPDEKDALSANAISDSVGCV